MSDDAPTRRAILTATLAATASAAVLSAPTPVAAQQPASGSPPKEPTAVTPEYYELRTYRLRRGPMGRRLDDYLKDAFIPAARRAGCGPVGAFTVSIGPGNPSTYVLVPHPTLDGFATLPDRLSADPEYRKAAEPFLAAPPADPPFANSEVQLLQAFPHVPRIEVPPPTQRIFELRTYRSHNDRSAAKKVEMFDTAGEVPIFRRTGLTPVLFARNLTGPDLPNLTYLLTFPDLATRERSWNTFRTDPEWKKLSGTPGFTDAEIVVDIHNQVLAPTAYSQV